MDDGKRRLAGGSAQFATNNELKDLRQEASALKKCVADLILENRLLRKSIIAEEGNDARGPLHPKSPRSAFSDGR